MLKVGGFTAYSTRKSYLKSHLLQFYPAEIMQLPLAYQDVSIIEEVPLDLWRKVFDAVGWPSSLASKKNTFTHEKVVHAFERDNLADELLLALEALHTLGTELGRDAIVTAMNDRRVPLETLPTSTGEREFALYLFLSQRNNASLADVFARAQIQVEEGSERRRYDEFLGKGASSVSNLKEKRDALQKETLQYCRDNDLGEHVQVRAFEDDGDYVFHIIRSHHTKNPLAVVHGSSARATIQFRPVHGDILRYQTSVGRLRIAARAASVVEFYRRTFGRVLFDDALFFAGEPVCSLNVLQQQGRSAFGDHGIAGIGRVWVTECLWERGDRDFLHIRSTDCFRNIEELRLPLTEGVLIQAKLKMEVVGKSTRPVIVNIRAPSRIELSQQRHEQIVDRFLSRVGIRNAPRRLQNIDLVSLYPWRHPIAVWRALFGRETDDLIVKRVLIPIQLSSVPSAGHMGAGRVLEAHAISNGEFYGVSQASEIPSRSLSSTDLDGFELAPEQLRIYLRAQLGISGAGVSWDGNEMLDIGDIQVGDQRIHLMYVLRQFPPNVGDSIRARAGGAHPVLLIPSSQVYSSELAKVMLYSPLPARHRLVRDAIAACGMTASLPAIYSAPDGARLVVDTKSGKIWVDGELIPDLHPDTDPFRFVELLAKKSPSAVSKGEFAAKIVGAREDGDTSVRQAKHAAKKSIVAAMAEAGRAFNEDPFPSAGTGCYRCALPSYVT